MTLTKTNVISWPLTIFSTFISCLIISTTISHLPRPMMGESVIYSRALIIHLAILLAALPTISCLKLFTKHKTKGYLSYICILLANSALIYSFIDLFD